MSLARFYPALFSVAGTGPYRYGALPGAAGTDRRSRLLFLRLLGQWAQLGGGVSRKLHLHARRLVIPHPVKQTKIDVTAPLPEHMLASWSLLGFDETKFEK